MKKIYAHRYSFKLFFLGLENIDQIIEQLEQTTKYFKQVKRAGGKLVFNESDDYLYFEGKNKRLAKLGFE